MAMTFRKQSKRWAPDQFKEPMTGTTAYAQALAYNEDGVDLYSQNWSADLMPATRMDELTSVLARMRERAPGSFDEIRDRLSEIRDFAGWRRMNVR